MSADWNSAEPRTAAANPPAPAQGSAGSKLRGALIVIALFPVLAGLILCVQGDFDSFGTWIDPLVLALGSVALLVVWGVTGKSQR